MVKSRLSIRDYCFIAIFVAVIAVLAQISIPMPLGVPLTLQTFAVPLAGAVLGAKRGAVAAIVYLLLGAVGAPVFAQFGGGLHRLVGPRGGYLLSYPFFAFAVGFGADKGTRLWLALGLIVGSIINLSMGMFQLALVGRLTILEAFLAGVAPFLIVELIKLVMVFIVAPKLRQILERFR